MSCLQDGENAAYASVTSDVLCWLSLLVCMCFFFLQNHISFFFFFFIPVHVYFLHGSIPVTSQVTSRWRLSLF